MLLASTQYLCSIHTSYLISEKVHFCLIFHFRRFAFVGSVKHGTLVRTFVIGRLQSQTPILLADITTTAAELSAIKINSKISSVGGVVSVQR